MYRELWWEQPEAIAQAFNLAMGDRSRYTRCPHCKGTGTSEVIRGKICTACYGRKRLRM